MKTYYATPEDPGTLAMFCSQERLGQFALEPTALQRGDAAALFQLLVGTVLFQRQRDLQVLRILRGLSANEIRELTDVPRLLVHALNNQCVQSHSVAALHASCDVGKDAGGKGMCGQRPVAACDLKRHAELLRRYGDFGKVPTSAALLLHEAGQPSLAALFTQVCRSHRTRRARAVALEAALLRVWRVSYKLANMYLSILANPDLNPNGPWAAQLDWTYFVVVDSNVDRFLASVNYEGAADYGARREFLQALARGIDLRTFHRDLHAYNPRLVQQALYLFMSASNRRESAVDCSRAATLACGECPRPLSTRCQVRPEK
ncbi:hypothetical protein KRR26_34945 [Corallococcus sp. M34]|uniref:hypothetical protein n=1 Tax=Citreicoccus inhibens TaxID=2849499 RepID=UPI001C2109C3|nr:hypothetical protein [Citreicoccus inhibens]MBU8900815.1 hypothetical protein [Citreicoccus inhibens]